MNKFTFKVFTNFSVEPKFEIFYFRNKVEDKFFRELRGTISMKYSFDWQPGVAWWNAMRYGRQKQ